MKQAIGWKTANKKLTWYELDLIWVVGFCLIMMVLGSIFIIRPEEAINGQAKASGTQIEPEQGKTLAVGQILPKTTLIGVASWYDYDLDGIEWSKSHNTCATRDFKRYSTIRVTNLANGKSVDCYVNDYGPELGQTPERHIDLSSHAFREIANLKLGLIQIRVEEIN